jgi:hypothetical protein
MDKTIQDNRLMGRWFNPDKYIYAAPYDDGRWQVWGEAGLEKWTPEVYNTKKQAIKAMPAYAKLVGWERGSYFKSIDE